MGFAATSLAVLLLASPTTQQPDRRYIGAEFDSFEDGRKSLSLNHQLTPLEVPKISPKHEWEFQFVSSGFARRPGTDQFNLRLRVFAQIRKEDPMQDVALHMTRMLLRLWDMNFHRLRLDHAEKFHLRSVDVYLCFGGEAGAEQLFTYDSEGEGSPRPANNIYFYEITSFTNPIEMAREVAHEYGHATLPPIGGFTAPENWANGDVGERLYLTWLRDLVAAGKANHMDTMGATLEQLNTYVAQKVTPLVVKIGTAGPNLALLGQSSKEAFMEYVGLTVYAGVTLPRPMFARSLGLSLGSNKATDYAKRILEAASESRTWSPTIPTSLKGKTIWLPVGPGKVTGGKALANKSGWVKVQPTAAKVTITNPPIKES